MWLKTTIGISREKLRTSTDHHGCLDYADAGQEELEVTVEGDVVEREGELQVLGFRSDEDLDKRQREDAEMALRDEYEQLCDDEGRVQTSGLTDGFERVLVAYNAALFRKDLERIDELTRKLALVSA